MNYGVLLQLVLAVVVVGGLLYLLALAPIDETMKKIGKVLVILIAIVWALKWLIGALG
jgi:hypothetical protein